AVEDLANAKHNLRAYEATKMARISALNLAKANFDRSSKLRATGAVSQEELDTRQNNLEATKSDLVTIEAQINAQESGVRRMEKMLKEQG
ncbi:hypothetical protein ABTC31_19880, partial [Acinetobacter baumannii]